MKKLISGLLAVIAFSLIGIAQAQVNDMHHHALVIQNDSGSIVKMDVMKGADTLDTKEMGIHTILTGKKERFHLKTALMANDQISFKFSQCSDNKCTQLKTDAPSTCDFTVMAADVAKNIKVEIKKDGTCAVSVM